MTNRLNCIQCPPTANVCLKQQQTLSRKKKSCLSQLLFLMQRGNTGYNAVFEQILK